MPSFIGSVKSALKTAVSAARGLFGDKKHTRRRKKVVVPAPPPVAPVPPPVAPVPTPQIAGRKMRAANLRKLNFYKPRRATRRR